MTPKRKKISPWPDRLTLKQKKLLMQLGVGLTLILILFFWLITRNYNLPPSQKNYSDEKITKDLKTTLNNVKSALILLKKKILIEEETTPIELESKIIEEYKKNLINQMSK